MSGADAFLRELFGAWMRWGDRFTLNVFEPQPDVLTFEVRVEARGQRFGIAYSYAPIELFAGPDFVYLHAARCIESLRLEVDRA